MKIAKSSKGYYVGWLYQEGEVTKTFARLTDYLSSKKEALEWVETIIDEEEDTDDSGTDGGTNEKLNIPTTNEEWLWWKQQGIQWI